MASCCTRLPLTFHCLSRVISPSRLHYSSSAKLCPSFSSLSLSRFASAPCSTAASSSPSIQTRAPEAGSVKSPAIERNVIEVLQERGLVESVTHDDIRSACANPTSCPMKVYCGFDPTAESLHLGNLLGLIVLSWFQRCGHIPVALLGGATARVGDPSGKSVERPSLDEETIERNLKGVQVNIERVLRVRVRANDASGAVDASGCDASRKDVNACDASDDMSSSVAECTHVNNARDMHSLDTCNGARTHPAIVLNNFDWWNDFSLLRFLRDVGKYARVGTMMSKESVKKRLTSDEGMSFTEFTYQLLQGYDFVHLYKNEGVSIQIGGSDQWGNIIAGTDLIGKVLSQERAYGLTFPLLLKSDGTKFGKSESGAIWLAPSMLSPYRFYQHLFATPDADVIVFLKRLTFLSLEEIGEVETAMAKPDYVPNSAQRKLAKEVTRFVHGEDGLEEALKATDALAPGGTTRLDWRLVEAIAADLPSYATSASSVQGFPLVDLCVSSGLLASKGAVRRLIKQGGLYLNNEKVDDEAKIVEQEDIVDNKMILLSAGKKNKIVVRLQ